MKQLTQKEEEIMERMWDHGPMLVRELQACYDEPRPHVNTLATLMKILEVNKFFGKSYLSAVSALVKSEKVSVEDLKELIREVEESNQQ